MTYISVVIPTYDRIELTLRAIDSVKTKNPELVEIIVVDDAGKDVFFFPSHNNKNGVSVQVVRMSVNSGAGLARMRGVESASGQYVAFLDSDDEYVEGWIDSLISHSGGGGGILFVGRSIGGKKICVIVRKFL
ncbi:glycosyltransferase family 2 protein [Comamonas testosteroni]|uniref:Glycosyltransferase family 2 protein n=1 Tax=Comamonas testosteroni TaxID=285 RepID=A0A373FPG8_COMTE|nr:glycosyltransferase family 2 protein [Comamonas testosteroni]RGE46048.1 glycosyltransferase family 2 protein [Comamonas testosteroni]